MRWWCWCKTTPSPDRSIAWLLSVGPIKGGRLLDSREIRRSPKGHLWATLLSHQDRINPILKWFPLPKKVNRERRRHTLRSSTVFILNQNRRGLYFGINCKAGRQKGCFRLKLLAEVVFYQGPAGVHQLGLELLFSYGCLWKKFNAAVFRSWASLVDASFATSI